jgi:hypothetical protein
MLVVDPLADRRRLPAGSVVVRVVPEVRAPAADARTPRATPRSPTRHIPAQMSADDDAEACGSPGDLP